MGPNLQFEKHYVDTRGTVEEEREKDAGISKGIIHNCSVTLISLAYSGESLYGYLEV